MLSLPMLTVTEKYKNKNNNRNKNKYMRKYKNKNKNKMETYRVWVLARCTLGIRRLCRLVL